MNHQQHELRVHSEHFWAIRIGGSDLPLVNVPTEFKVGDSLLLWEKQPMGGHTGRNEIRRIKEIRRHALVLEPWSREGIVPVTVACSVAVASGEQDVARVAARVCRYVAELPDRTSPAEWPEAMLVTQAELRSIVMATLATEPDRTAARSEEAEQAAMYRWLRDNSATYVSSVAPIQLIVQETADVHRSHGADGYRKGLDAAIRSLMGDEKGGSNG